MPLFVGGTAVSLVDAVLNLGVTFDAQLTMKNHVDNVVRSCFFQIRQLRSVRRSLRAVLCARLSTHSLHAESTIL